MMVVTMVMRRRHGQAMAMVMAAPGGGAPEHDNADDGDEAITEEFDNRAAPGRAQFAGDDRGHAVLHAGPIEPAGAGVAIEVVRDRAAQVVEANVP